MNQIAFASWLDYREKLLPIIQQTEQRNNHKFADEINSALSDERAFLFMASDGFMVLEPLVMNDMRGVNILFAWNDGGDACIRYQPIIEQLAHEIGAAWLEFQTKVSGLQLICHRLGYKLVETDGSIKHYRKDL